ncbi:MAG: bifunctional metallophosphatase/5'-nucleotidase [Bacteroidota bacterium]|nr:bifunctional metallophosphatase/5'-nucleotidase [Bacteroidota bacterium]
MKNFSTTLLKRLTTLLFFVSSAAAFALAQPQGGLRPKTITILHTNDIHASFIPREAFWIKKNPKPVIGGMNELSFVIDSLRKAKPATLLLDAGDVMTGNPVTEYKYKGAYGGALFQMMDMIGYDAWCLGNHDFDISQENLLKLTHIANFPTLCANVVNTDGKFPLNNKPYKIFERGGVKIGVIGIILQSLYHEVNQNNLVGIKVLSPVETTQRYIDELKLKADIIVALTHEGVDDDVKLAENVTGLSIIVGGHSHTRLTKPKVVDGVLIVQTGSNCENLGVLDLTIEDHHVTSYNGTLIPLWYNSARPKTALSAFIDSVQQAIEKDYHQVIGTLTADWVRKEGESAIGTFIAAAQQKAAHADVGFMNDHGIRKNVPAGPITKQDLFEVLPFRNVLVTFQLSGTELEKIVRHFLSGHASVQISGIDCAWKKGDAGIEIVSMKVDGKPFDENKTYIGAASDYLVGEAKRYLGIEIQQPIFLQQTVFEAVEKAVREQKVIMPTDEKHFVEVETQ